MKKKKPVAIEQATPLMIHEAHASSSSSSNGTRRNVAGSIERTERFKNIDEGLVPFRNNTVGYGDSKSSVDIREAVMLCQKCYWNFALFRNIIDLMTEFSVTNIFFRGGSANSRDFFTALANKINLWDLQDRFFREYYRSGNVFVYRFDATIKPEDISKITQTFGADSPISQIDTPPYVIPAKYIILNPADIQILGTANFSRGIYYKMMTEYEVARLRKPANDEDKAIFDSLPPDVKAQILKGVNRVMIPIDFDKTSAIFYKKQDYEPFAVPMGYPVLEDINAKYEMKKIDMAIARTMQQIILLVTTGTEPEKGGINKENLIALKKLFENQSVGRVLVADYTTEAEWKVPAIGDLLNPEKYQVLDRDINIGLNNIFSGDEKFANQAQKVEIFIARLEQGRKSFLNNFLIPEIKRIAKSLNFKNYPTPYFEDIELKDNSNNSKLYARMMEMGLLTPEQGFKAIEDNTLPDTTTMVQEQQDYKALRDKGLYLPLVGGTLDPANDNGSGAGGAGGRPAGSKAPRLTKKINPIGTKASEEQFSITKLKDNFILVQALEGKIESYLKKKHKIKKLDEAQKEIAVGITHLIVANEEIKDWDSKVEQYCEAPVDTNPNRVEQIYDVAARHQIDHYLASVLYASKV